MRKKNEDTVKNADGWNTRVAFEFDAVSLTDKRNLSEQDFALICKYFELDGGGGGGGGGGGRRLVATTKIRVVNLLQFTTQIFTTKIRVL